VSQKKVKQHRRRVRQEILKTIWRVPEDAWAEVRKLLSPEKALHTPGRPVVPFRRVFDGFLYVLRTGCQWKAVPKEFGSGSTVHRRFQQWERRGVFKAFWRLMLKRYDRRRGIGWTWQSVDTKTVPAPLGGAETGPNPTDRAKSGSKRHQLVDRRGAPLSAIVTGANATDMKTNPRVLDELVVRRPRPTTRRSQHLCEGKGYDTPECREQARQRGYVAHIPRKGSDPHIVPTRG
jgi:putative transposase